jgi:hypothetical protein
MNLSEKREKKKKRFSMSNLGSLITHTAERGIGIQDDQSNDTMKKWFHPLESTILATKKSWSK